MSRMPRRTLAALTLLSAATLLSATACSSDGDAGTNKRSVRSAEPNPAKATPAADSKKAGELAERAPDLLGDRVVLRQSRTQDSASLEFGKARKGDGEALAITVSCEGKGRIEVVLRPTDASFFMDCLEGEVTSIHNRFAVDGADRAGTVSVTAASGVRWSLSVGRGEPAEQDLSG
ncbi:hypothetical protein [Streptomyces sp. DSM 40750]|uniref:hypothetical protein n=1 Tax=Streptomyces sp. DSM 40750 TaxID=2801030 RepID=UPI00214B6E60|nr:hypothetical protein [Streptomyces sp. DSM 40750]UUU22921.1 hypothetical protein JIX55_22965 [Streptomyces sp. DSM 40750]